MGQSLVEFLMKHEASSSVSFHMPGHKGKRFYESLGYGHVIRNLVGMDITEIPGADNLFQAESVIKNVMERYSNYYSDKKPVASYLSIGGSSTGLIASILAVAEGTDKPTILMARNCHKSVYNGVKLSGKKPVYLYPDILDDFGLAGEIKAEDVESAIRASSMEANGGVGALIIASPNYYGVMSDVEAISEVCARNDVVLIVDQAHGAHLKMLHHFYPHRMPAPAEECGADIVVSSTHKTMASFTQTAILNLCSNRVDKKVLEDKLQMIQSSSPSYILMASLDMNIDIVENHGEELSRKWIENLDYFYREAEKIEGMEILKSCDFFDPAKLVFSFRKRGQGGDSVAKALLEKNIILELWDGTVAMGMTGIGNERGDYEALIAALRELPWEEVDEQRVQDLSPSEYVQRAPKYIAEMVGEIATQSIIPYPPGIPLIAAGEVITAELLGEAVRLRINGHKVIGLDMENR